MTHRVFLLSLLLASPAVAQETFTEVGGRTYVLDPFVGGADLLAFDTHPVEWMMITKDCRAFHPEAGDGSWSWNKGGFSVTIDWVQLSFIGQGPPIDAPACSH
jgi:hypothetical protein